MPGQKCKSGQVVKYVHDFGGGTGCHNKQQKPTVTECIYRVAWLIPRFDVPQMFEAFAGSVSLVLALAIR